jgi:hypothetical protein
LRKVGEADEMSRIGDMLGERSAPMMRGGLISEEKDCDMTLASACLLAYAGWPDSGEGEKRPADASAMSLSGDLLDGRCWFGTVDC